MQPASKNRLSFMTLFFALLIPCNAVKISNVSPSKGSICGATMLTISGEGFAQASQFQLKPGNGDGNRVTLVSDTMSFVCDVERDSTHGNQIMCYTRAMPDGTYDVKVTVDGVPIPNSDICKECYEAREYRTPTIRSLDLLSGLPGSLLTIHGRIFTDALASSNRNNSNPNFDTRIVRAYIGGMPCELLKPDSDEPYRLELKYGGSWWGHMSCKMTGSYIGHHNLSFITDGGYGRSTPESHLYQVSSLNKLGMFQTFAEVTGVSPSQGSIKGGTTLTIHGRHLGDQTDYPARVVVGGLPCEVLHVADDKILCKTSEWKPNEFAEFGVGGRGLKMEIWNDTRPGTLEEIWTYNENATGYWTQWIDSTPHLFADEHDYFTTRTRGFLVPPSTGKFILHLQCDDRCELYMSNSSRPEHKEKLAFQTSNAKAFSRTSQQSKDLFLEEGKPYYIEIIQQESRGKASVTLAMFSEKSSYTEKQTSNAQNEVQILIAEYDVHDETQVVAFEAWTSKVAVKEVQKVTIVSGGNDLFSLGYGPALTAPLAVSASASVVEAALNDLWSIKPDTVKVSKAEDGGSTHFTITFNSDRGDFAPLTFNDFGADINITVVEATKGQSNMETFTLTWENVPTRPIAYNATEEEMQSALEELFTPKCPAEIVTSVGPDVKYFKDFEDDDNSTFDGKPVKNVAFCGLWSVKNSKTIFKDTYLQGSGKEYGPIPLNTFPWLCFAYKGLLNDEVTLSFTYRNFQRQTVSGTTSISVLFHKGPTWSYKCINLLSSLQGEFAGSLYQMTHLSVGSDGDFYIDAVHIGRLPTTNDENAVAMKRMPSPFESSGRAFESISVSKDGSALSYQISAKTMDCTFGFPMIEVGFMQKSKDDEDMGKFTEGAAVVTVTRTHKATPPLNGTFDVEIYEDHVKGLSIDINEEDLERDLQRISEMGEVEVKYVGTCRKPQWRVEWVSKPGNQPEIKIDSSNIVGPNVHFFSQENKEGGMLHPRIMGDHFRVMEAKPQVQVFINNIPSWCSGDCSFSLKDGSNSGSTLGPSSLSAVSVIYAVAYCSETLTVF